MYDLILSFVTAFFVTHFAIPVIIKVAHKKHLYDVPSERSSHATVIPRLGGIGIFAGIFFSISFWAPYKSYSELQFVLCSFIIIFLIGAKDDIDPVSPAKKFLGEIAAALLLILRADIRITDFQGVFGIYELPYVVSIAFTLFTMLLIINAVNLIDGINGLSGGVGVVMCSTFGGWFYLAGHMELAIVAFAVTGALIAFLDYNVTPAKVFMGDTGALLLGLIVAILAVQFIEANRVFKGEFSVVSAPAVAIGIMVVPLFDTLRVFTTRVMRGKSPFYPDRTHIHHLLLDTGLSHLQASGVLVAANIVFIAVAFQLQHVGTLVLTLVLFAMALLLTLWVRFLARRRTARLSKV